jgi:hypothetical protein
LAPFAPDSFPPVKKIFWARAGLSPTKHMKENAYA